MGSLKFNEDDKQKVIDFLNFVAANAKFNIDTDQTIKYFKLLSHMQQQILPKLSANILEVKKVVEAKPEEQPLSKHGRGKKE